MKTYLITYDKSIVLKNYRPLYEAIKSCSGVWWHHMENTWLIRSEFSAASLYSRLKPHIAHSDRLLIIEIKQFGDYAGWLNQDAWNWISNQINKP